MPSLTGNPGVGAVEAYDQGWHQEDRGRHLDSPLHPIGMSPLLLGLLEVQESKGLPQRLTQSPDLGECFVDSVIDNPHSFEVGAGKPGPADVFAQPWPVQRIEPCPQDCHQAP